MSFTTPRAFFLGLTSGLVLLAALGRAASYVDRLDNFHRFFLPITPQSNFYPTAASLRNTVTSTVGPEKIIVLVGGSSIFRGLGQNRHEVWTSELQRLLGERYAVVNFAMDHAGFMAAAFGPGAIDGNDPYTYLFWDAYYKGMLNLSESERRLVTDSRNQEIKAEGRVSHVSAVLDSLFYFNSLWQFVTYRCVSTSFSRTLPRSPFSPRRNYNEEVIPTYIQVQADRVVDHDMTRQVLQNLRYYGTGFVERDGDLIPDARFWSQVTERFREVLAPEMRNKTLAVLLKENPRYIEMLPGLQRRAHRLTFDSAERALVRAGYSVLQFGDELQPSDYLDHGHLMPSGGRRLAASIASHIQQLARELAY